MVAALPSGTRSLSGDQIDPLFQSSDLLTTLGDNLQSQGGASTEPDAQVAPLSCSVPGRDANAFMHYHICHDRYQFRISRTPAS